MEKMDKNKQKIHNKDLIDTNNINSPIRNIKDEKDLLDSHSDANKLLTELENIDNNDKNEKHNDDLSKSLSEINHNNSYEDKKTISIDSNSIFQNPPLISKKIIVEIDQLSQRVSKDENENETNNRFIMKELRLKYFPNNKINKNAKNIKNNYINYNENKYKILSFELNEENFNDKEDYEITSQEKNNLYFINSPQLAQEINNEIDFNSNEKIPSPKSKLNLPNNDKTKTTNDNTIFLAKPIISKAKVFEIKKIKKTKLGRKKLNQIYNSKNVHTKYNKDNIITKIKRNINANFLENLNLNLRKSKNPNLNKIQLVKIDTSVITVSKKEKNIDLLDQEIKYTLSSKITPKFLYLEKDYNKKNIEFILQQNDKEINYQLNLTNREILDIYSNNRKVNPNFKNFKTLEDDLEKLKTKHDHNYLKLYEYIVKNFESIINKIVKREKKKY